MSPFLLVLCILALIGYLFLSSKDRPPNFPPGPPALPVWGSYWFVLARNFTYSFKAFADFSKEYNSPVIGMKYGSDNIVVANDFETVREALLKPEFQGRPDGFVFRYRSFGRILGIFFADGPFWKVQRRFALRHMRDFGFGRRSQKLEEMTSEYIRDFVDLLNSNLHSHKAYKETVIAKEKSCDVRLPQALMTVPSCAYAGVLTGNSIALEDQPAATKFGHDVLLFQRSNDVGGGSLHITPWVRFFPPIKAGYQACLQASKNMNDYMRKLYKSVEETLYPGDDRNFVDRYLFEMKRREGSRSSFTDKQLIMTMVDFMFATSSTLPVTMSLALLRLVKHPEIAQKLRDEIDQVVGRGRFPHLDDRQNLHYFEAFLREAMRCDTLVPLSLAHRATEDTTFNGYFIPKGTGVLTNVWAAHRDPKAFVNPLEFKPERFLNAENRLITKDLTMPFGLGQRLCAGETFARQVMFLFLTALIQNFEFTAPDDKELPDLKKLLPGIIVSPPDFWLKFTPRPH